MVHQVQMINQREAKAVSVEDPEISSLTCWFIWEPDIFYKVLRSLNVKQDTGLQYKNGSLIFSRVHSSFGEQESSIYACKKAVCVDAFWGFPGASILKRIFCQCRRCRFHPWVRKFPWRRKWQPIPVFLPGKSHRQRSLAGCSPRGCGVGHNRASKQQRHLPFGLWGLRKETTAAVLLQRVAPPGPFRPRGRRKLPCRVLALKQSDFIFLPDLPHSTTFFWRESRVFSGTWSFLALGLCYFHC